MALLSDQGHSQDFKKGVSIKIARLRAAKFLKPRPEISQIMRSTYVRTAMTIAALVDMSVRSSNK